MNHHDSLDYHLIHAAVTHMVADENGSPGELLVSIEGLQRMNPLITLSMWRASAPTIASALEADGHFVKTDYRSADREWIVFVFQGTRRVGLDGSTWRELGMLQAERETGFIWKNQITSHQSLPSCAASLLNTRPDHLRHTFHHRVSMTARLVSAAAGKDPSVVGDEYYLEITQGFFSRLEELSRIGK